MISKHFDKNNLHHAYLLEGERDVLLPEVQSFADDLGVKTVGNPDYIEITIDNFKIDDAFSLREMAGRKSFSEGRRIFVLSASQFSREAQNALLKLFEEPGEDTHFFLLAPDADALIPTLRSRFYIIRQGEEKNKVNAEIEKFLHMPLPAKLEFIKNIVAEADDEIFDDSPRTKALQFLNNLESALHSKMSKTVFDTAVFEQILKARKYLRQPGSGTKMLLESVALSMPEKV